MIRCRSAAETLGASQHPVGILDEGFPYIRIDGGSRRLVILPGVGDAMFSGRYPLGIDAVLRVYVRRYLDEYTVYLLSRPRGLAEGYTIQDSASSHALVLEHINPVDVVGISMGGLICQQLCRHHSELVDQCVLVSTATRLGEPGRPAVTRMLESARKCDWGTIRSDLARAMFSDVRALTYPPLIQTAGRCFLPQPAEAEDVTRSFEAILEYDGRDDLESISQPTLVIGGDRDPYFTADVQRETATGLPRGELSLIAGAKHGAFHERKYTFDRRTLAFLGRESA